MTDRRGGVMTDATRDEIVRLARKGWDANEIALDLNADSDSDRQDMPDLEPEQVQQVIDEADREVERMVTPTVPQDTDAIGRIAKWLDDAREAGYGSRDIAQMLISAVGELTDAASDHELEGQDDDALADQLDALAEGTNEPLGWKRTIE